MSVHTCTTDADAPARPPPSAFLDAFSKMPPQSTGGTVVVVVEDTMAAVAVAAAASAVEEDAAFATARDGAEEEVVSASINEMRGSDSIATPLGQASAISAQAIRSAATALLLLLLLHTTSPVVESTTELSSQRRCGESGPSTSTSPLLASPFITVSFWREQLVSSLNEDFKATSLKRLASEALLDSA
jgi:hypothetical protein